MEATVSSTLFNGLTSVSSSALSSFASIIAIAFFIIISVAVARWLIREFQIMTGVGIDDMPADNSKVWDSEASQWVNAQRDFPPEQKWNDGSRQQLDPFADRVATTKKSFNDY